MKTPLILAGVALTLPLFVPADPAYAHISECAEAIARIPHQKAGKVLFAGYAECPPNSHESWAELKIQGEERVDFVWHLSTPMSRDRDPNTGYRPGGGKSVRASATEWCATNARYYRTVVYFRIGGEHGTVTYKTKISKKVKLCTS